MSKCNESRGKERTSKDRKRKEKKGKEGKEMKSFANRASLSVNVLYCCTAQSDKSLFNRRGWSSKREADRRES